jgi:hypothetical protein
VDVSHAPHVVVVPVGEQHLLDGGVGLPVSRKDTRARLKTLGSEVEAEGTLRGQSVLHRSQVFSSLGGGSLAKDTLNVRILARTR